MSMYALPLQAVRDDTLSAVWLRVGTTIAAMTQEAGKQFTPTPWTDRSKGKHQNMNNDPAEPEQEQA